VKPRILVDVVCERVGAGVRAVLGTSPAESTEVERERGRSGLTRADLTAFETVLECWITVARGGEDKRDGDEEYREKVEFHRVSTIEGLGHVESDRFRGAVIARW
jgi:hypothetical protein